MLPDVYKWHVPGNKYILLCRSNTKLTNRYSLTLTGQQEARTRWGTHVSGAEFDKKKSTFLTPQARSFIAEQVFCVIAGLGKHDEIRSLMVIDMPGFVQTLDQQTCLLPLEQQLATSHLVQGLRSFHMAGHRARLSLCFIRHTTRERLCVHGDAELLSDTTNRLWLRLHVTQAFFHCPKYIHTQVPGLTAIEEQPLKHKQRTMLEDCSSVHLSAEIRTFIAQQAHCFLCTVDQDGQSAVNHRGGAPGFLVTRSPDNASPGGIILLPDYKGNGAFEAIGNVLETGQAALLLPCFEHHIALSITAKSYVLEPGDISSALRQQLPAAQRIIALSVQHIERQSGDWSSALAYELARARSSANAQSPKTCSL